MRIRMRPEISTTFRPCRVLWQRPSEWEISAAWRSPWEREDRVPSSGCGSQHWSAWRPNSSPAPSRSCTAEGIPPVTFRVDRCTSLPRGSGTAGNLWLPFLRGRSDRLHADVPGQSADADLSGYTADRSGLVSRGRHAACTHAHLGGRLPAVRYHHGSYTGRSGLQCDLWRHPPYRIGGLPAGSTDGCGLCPHRACHHLQEFFRPALLRRSDYQ